MGIHTFIGFMFIFFRFQNKESVKKSWVVIILSLVVQTISESVIKWLLSKPRSKVQAHIHARARAHTHTCTYPFLGGNTNALSFVIYPTVPIIPIKKIFLYYMGKYKPCETCCNNFAGMTRRKLRSQRDTTWYFFPPSFLLLFVNFKSFAEFFLLLFLPFWFCLHTFQLPIPEHIRKNCFNVSEAYFLRT